MSSMLWAAAATVVVPPPVTAEQLMEAARERYSVEEPRREACPGAREDEIVVCREIGDPERYRVPSDTESGLVKHDIPRAPNVSSLPDCSQATCIRMGPQPRQVNLIDLGAIPEAPPGSDADRIGKGELGAP